MEGIIGVTSSCLPQRKLKNRLCYADSGNGKMSQQYSDREVLEELERLLASKGFAGANRAARFLRYVVERSLANDRAGLKEVVIGTEVFDRPAGYDPKIEPIVRIEARRLRTKLDDFYEARTDSAVRISVPKGAYLASFERCGDPQAKHPVTERIWTRPAWIVVALAILLIGGISAALLRLGDGTRTPAAPVVTTVTAFPGGQYFPSLSPDGNRVAFVWRGDNQEWGNVYVSKVEGGSPARITNDPAGDVFPIYSPDGTRIAFIRNNRGLMTVGTDGANERFLAKAYPSSLTWSPDGKQLVYSYWTPDHTRFALFATDPQTGASHQISDPPTDVNGDFYADFSPDNRQLAFARCATGSCNVMVMPMSGGRPRRIATDSVQGLTWSPDGRTVVYSSKRLGQDRLWRLVVSGSREPQPIALAGDGALHPRFGRNAAVGPRMIFEHHIENSNIWRINPSHSAAPERVGASTKLDSSPQVSPDGSRIAFISDRSGFKEIWSARADGSDPIALTDLRLEAGSPRWSPDGRRVAFDNVSKEGRAIFVVNATGGKAERWTPWGDAGRPSWSRDGAWIYFGGRDKPGATQVFKVSSLSPAEPVQITSDGGFEAFESVDGKTLFYAHDGELRRIPPAGGVSETVWGPVRMGSWSVARNGIYFIDFGAARFSGPQAIGEKVIYLIDPATAKARRIASFKGDFNSNLPDFCASLDGETLYYSVREVSISQIRMMEGGI
jgi:Tol biopolymer transport system component